MKTLQPEAAARCRTLAWLFLALVLLLQEASAPAVAALPQALPAARSRAPVVLAAAWRGSGVWHLAETAVNSRRRMIQFATIGFCIGIYILMRR